MKESSKCKNGKTRMRQRRRKRKQEKSVLERKVVIVKYTIKFASSPRQIKEENPTLLHLPLEALVPMVRRSVVVECSFNNSQGYAYNQRATEEEYDGHGNDTYPEAPLLASALHSRGVWLVGVVNNNMARLGQRRS